MLAAHGIAGFTGILFIGLFAQVGWNGDRRRPLLRRRRPVLVDRRWRRSRRRSTRSSATFVLLKLIGAVMPLRASEHEEAIGMDVVQHGEEAYVTGEGAILVLPDGDEGPTEVPVANPG